MKLFISVAFTAAALCLATCAVVDARDVSDGASGGSSERKFNPGHYIAMNGWDKRSDIRGALRPGVQGVQIRYPWILLEPEKDRYDFSAIEADLAVLEGSGRQLVAFIFDKSFKDERYTPRYLWSEHTLPSNANSKHVGYVAKRWDPYVVERMGRLIRALSQSFDDHPRFEGIAIQESAIGTPKAILKTAGYTPEKYRDALITLLQNAAESLPRSRVFWYMNFLSGGQKYIADISAAVAPYQVAIGGPDILPGHPPLERHVYPVLRSVRGTVTFNSAQYASFRWQRGTSASPSLKQGNKTAPRNYWTPREIFEYARDDLGVSYIFWNRAPEPKRPNTFGIEDAYPVIAEDPIFGTSLAGWREPNLRTAH